MNELFAEVLLLVILISVWYTNATGLISWFRSRQKREVGPHIIVRKPKQFPYNAECKNYCWECKYCGKWSADPDSISFTEFACEEFRHDGGLKENRR